MRDVIRSQFGSSWPTKPDCLPSTSRLIGTLLPIFTDWRLFLPAWKPGTRQAYHAISLGFYEGELLRRIDPQHRSLGRFFQEDDAALVAAARAALERNRTIFLECG